MDFKRLEQNSQAPFVIKSKTKNLSTRFTIIRVNVLNIL